MKVQEVLSQLKSMGNERMKAHYIKSGAQADKVFGLKKGDIRKVAKQVKNNHALALELWQTAYFEARLLAILIMNPKALSVSQLDDMVKSIDVPELAEWFTAYTLKEHPDKETLRQMWMMSDNIWAVRSGWSLTAGKIAKGAEDLDLAKLLDKIENEMPKAAPETQWTMNTALANIGIYHSEHRQRALDIGNKLGIYKDYPVPKGCVSPFVPIWINEMVSRQAK